MKKNLLGIALAAAVTSLAAAPIVVVPGSNAGYLYFPGSTAGGKWVDPPPGGSAGVTIDGLQLARTVCMTGSGTVPIPTGFTTGFVQAIVVAGGNSNGSPSSITHADIGTITALPGKGSGGGGARGTGTYGGAVGGGGGGGGYLGRGGTGGWRQFGSSTTFYGGGGGSSGGPGGQGGRDGAGVSEWQTQATGPAQGAGYGSREGGAVSAVTASIPPTPGGVGSQVEAPAAIMCPNAPTAGAGGSNSDTSRIAEGGTGFGAGGGGDGGSGQQSGQIVTVTWKYNGGAITVVVGAGGPAVSGQHAAGAPGVVALRFIPVN